MILKSKEEQDFEANNEQLKQLISQVDNSGISAWKAGSLLKIVRSSETYTTIYGTFGIYIKMELGISIQTANNYIKIHEQFTQEEIGNVMLISQLLVIADITDENVKKMLVKFLVDFSEFGYMYDEFDPEKYPSITAEDYYSAFRSLKEMIGSYKVKLSDVVGMVEEIKEHLNRKKCLSKVDIRNIVSSNIDVGEIIEKNHQKKEGPDSIFGHKLHPKYFNEVGEVFENEPINEMGLVAIFCVMFKSLCSVTFEWCGKNSAFVAIKYVRAAFPDACIRCKTDEKNKKSVEFELNIEFEFESYNYIRHKHLNSSRSCNLIICWEDNAKTNPKLKDNYAVKKMPPVISLKKCFETGKIELLW